MCDDCTQQAYASGEATASILREVASILTVALEEIADLHQGDWTPTRFMEGAAYCKGCDEWWPCITFLTAVGALNDVK